MYKEFFGFIREPFNITPETELFYCSKIHEEALNVIEYILEKRRGYVVLTGEVGTGKTLLCKTLIKRLHNYHKSFIINPFLTPEELLIQICKDFKIEINNNEKTGELFEKIKNFLINSYKKGENAVIIVDEAQNLSFNTFEMLRQISNIELEEAKLVQIILSGQQELLEKLNSEKLRQLSQRISTVIELKPLNFEETKNYINFRTNESLKYKKYIFSDAAIKKIYQYSKGYPREINQIAEIALLIAYSKNHKTVTKEDAVEAGKEYYYKKKIVKKDSNKRLKILVFILIVLIIFCGIYYYNLFTTKLTPPRKSLSIIKRKKIIDNKADKIKTKNQNTYFDIYIGPFSKKILFTEIRKLKSKKINFFVAKTNDNHYIIHLGFFRKPENLNNVLKKLKMYGFTNVNIKKIKK